ncbi:MAG: RagB/SusD family nutrient uptake outer membrane protein [Prevotella sp.]|nr:RagB/SusD family nutrient uptake outer membrane protein [Prevotella sp.]
MKRLKIFVTAICAICGFVSCSDFFDQESEQVIFTDKNHLTNATDSAYSVLGILNKLQAIADRTILLGEVRGDLVDLTTTANSDLRDIALFNVGDDNRYNEPRDYYAVINNCNYFIANADTALKNNRNEFIFMKEFAAVKAIRAWTYLQLVTTYGKVPFVTTPILTSQEAEKDYPMYGIEQICRYFISDLQELPELYYRDYPNYGTIRSVDSRLLWFPINIVLGDLNLWLASVTGEKATYREAALRYYKYLSLRNGDNSYYATGVTLRTWTPGSTNWINTTTWGTFNQFSSESVTSQGELITLIAGDSIRAEGNFSELRDLFSYNGPNNNGHVSIVPSQNMFDISTAQEHCCVTKSTTPDVYYAPKTGMQDFMAGDLRLSQVYRTTYGIEASTGERFETSNISKYSTRNVHIYRRMMVYLRMAEALNMGGLPRMAFQVLANGLNNETVSENVIPYCSASDSVFASQFDFPAIRYGLFTVEHLVNNQTTGLINTIGIHTRGSGWTPLNEYYQLPDDTLMTEDELRPIQQAFVDSLILNEGALELSFEGTRFYDLMRYALRQTNPGQTLADYVYARRGKNNSEAMRGEIRKDLTDQRNWFLQWNGRIGE